ncbi:MAG: DUF4214 domain-containing protein [Burkholderiales bacterium]|nr:DUF4214 domain-containing protein [Burkholderiales bacterium]
MAGINYQYELIKMYVAAFIRAPEKSGLEYWMLQLANGKSFDEVLDTVFHLDIVTEIYPLGLPNESFVTLIYVNVFGKSPDVEGLVYWSNQLQMGRGRGGLVMDMINAGLTTPDGTTGKAYVVNRLAAAQFAVDQQYAQQADLSPAYLKSVMASVGNDATTVTAANKSMTSSVTGIGIGAPLNALTVAAATDGISQAEAKAGVSVMVDLKGTNAVAGHVLELLMNRNSFSTPITKILNDADAKAQKVTLIIPNTVNWGADGMKTLSAFVKDPKGLSGLPGGDLTVELNIVPPTAPTKPLIVTAAADSINFLERSGGVSVRLDLTGTATNKGDKVEILLDGKALSPSASAVLSDADIKAGFVDIMISGAASWGADGEKTLSAQITDVSGNLGGTGGNLVVMLDSTPPGSLSKPLVITSAIGGLSPEEKNIAMTAIANLDGLTLKVGDAIELLIDGKPFINSTRHMLTAAEIAAKSVNISIAAGDSAWGTVDGDRMISARLIDSAGNLGVAGGFLKVSLDSVAPSSQNLTLQVAAAQNGLSASEINGGVAVTAYLTNSGAQAGDTLNLFIDGLAFNPAASLVLTSAHIAAKSAVLVVPTTANWGVDGAKTLTANIVDSAGNVGNPGGNLTVQVDKTAPGLPLNPISVPSALNGINASEKLAGVSVVVDLAGTGAVVNDTLEVMLDGASFTSPVTQVLSATDIANGIVNLMIPNAAGWGVDGTKNIAARVVDISGNVGMAGAALSVVLDTIAPAGPAGNLTVAANAGGGISTAERAAGVVVQVNLTGTTALAGDVVEILVGGLPFTMPVTHVLTASEVSAKSAALTIRNGDGWGADGNKMLTARFIDSAGNQGTAAGTVTVTLDGTAPNAVASAMTVTAAVNGINAAEKAAGVVVSVSLAGTGALAGDTLELQVGGAAFATPVTQVLTGAQITAGSVSLTIPSTAGWGSDGTKLLTATITDALNNVSAAGGNTSLLLDTVLPGTPTNAIVIAAATNGVNAAEKTAGVNVLVDLAGSGVVAGDKIEVLLASSAFSTPIQWTLTVSDINNGFANVLIPASAAWGADGIKLISVRMIDIADNVGTATNSISINLDTTAPIATLSPLVVAANSSGGGISAAEKNAGVTAVVDLTGTGLAAGDTVELLLGGSAFTNPVKKVLTSGEISGNSATVTIPSNAGWGVDGGKVLTTRFIDVAGNMSVAAGSLTVTLIDSIAPTAPSNPLAATAATNGISSAEKTAGVVVTASLAGTGAVAGDIANLFIDGAAFSADGSHTLSMGVTDVAGNVGATGGNLIVSLDTTAPTAPSSAVSVAAASNGINAVEKLAGVVVAVGLSGTNAVANDQIEILLGGAAFTTPIFHILTAGEITAGTANATIDTGAGWGADGVKTISARVIDIAGNVGAAGGSLTTTLDTVMPAASGLPVYVDVNSNGLKDAGDTYRFTITEATNKAIAIGNVTINNSHVFGTGAAASWSADGTQLTITLGTGATIVTGDIVTLVGVSDLAGNSLNLAFSV